MSKRSELDPLNSLMPEPFEPVPMGEPVDVPPTSARRLIWALPIVVGLALLVVSMAVITHSSATLRVVGGGIGIALISRGVQRVAGVTGPRLGIVVAYTWIVTLVITAVSADVLPLGEASDPSKTLDIPSKLRPDLLSAHPLGTDAFGLDVLSAVIHGARISLTVGVGAAALGILVGGGIGVLAGFYRGWFEWVVNLITNTMLAFPALILLLAMVTILRPTTINVTVALSILSIPTFVRLARVNTIVFAEREFILAARALGMKNRRLIFRQLVPNVALPVAAYGLVVVAVLIVAEASLSFLGLSIPRPQPTWGNMIAAGQEDFQRIPHLVFAPAAALFTTVLALNRIGDHARKRWDRRSSSL